MEKKKAKICGYTCTITPRRILEESLRYMCEMSLEFHMTARLVLLFIRSMQEKDKPLFL